MPLAKPEGFRELEEGFYSQGIDISHHQGDIDWELVFESTDSTIAFVYCKVSEGGSHLDRHWIKNFTWLRNHNIPLGAYHYYKPFVSPEKQAAHFLKNYDWDQDDLPPVLDIEEESTNDELLRKNLQIWLDLVEKATGKRPIIYTNFYLFNAKFQSFFSQYQFWIANYSDHPERMSDDRILYWQYSDHGFIPGIDGFVDLNMSKVKFK